MQGRQHSGHESSDTLEAVHRNDTSASVALVSRSGNALIGEVVTPRQGGGNRRRSDAGHHTIARRPRIGSPESHIRCEGNPVDRQFRRDSAGDRWRAVRTFIQQHGGRASRREAASAMLTARCDAEAAEGSLAAWLQAGMAHETNDGIILADTQAEPHASTQRLAPALDDDTRPRELALLSLFDGTGFARLAVEEAIAECDGAILVRSAFAEIDVTLGDRVHAHWRARHLSNTSVIPHELLARDVLDLLRPADSGPQPGHVAAGHGEVGQTPLARFAGSLPTRCVVLIVAGSPCQQLTFAGRHQGRQGVCGRESVHYFAVPTIAWHIQQLRPDAIVHVALENAASMRPEHRHVILQGLGDLQAGQHLRTLDSGRWSVFPRRRHYFLTIPTDVDPPRPGHREPPWEAGWAPHPTAVLGPMMCSRSSHRPRASTAQYHVQALVFRQARTDQDFDWHGLSYEQIRQRVLNIMPSEVRAVYLPVLRGGLTREQELSAQLAVTWIEDHGRELGFRVPSPSERARSTGRGEYLEALQLSPNQLYNAVGNHFDADALRVRLLRPLQQLFATGDIHRHKFMAPADLAIVYQIIAARVNREHIPTEPAAFPADLAAALTATFGPDQAREVDGARQMHGWHSHASRGTYAADTGRRAQ